jgi:hypothetical protein
MKAFLTAFFCIFSFLFCVTTEMFPADNQLITQLTVLDNDSSYRYLYLYDNSSHKVLETKYVQYLSDWLRKAQTEWVYNGDNCVSQIERIWLNNSWVVQNNISFEYVGNKQTTEIYTSYSNGNAVLEKKVIFAYNQNNLVEKSEQHWSISGWELAQKTTFTYTQNSQPDSVTTVLYEASIPTQYYLSVNNYTTGGLLKSQTTKTKTPLTDWENSEFSHWYYQPGTTQITTQIKKRWQPEILNWENVQRVDYQYGLAGELVSEIYQNWKLVFWNDDIKYSYQYQTPTKLLKKTISFPLYHEWRNLISINYSDFTADKANVMESKFEFWGGATGELTTSYIPFLFNDDMTIKKGKRIEISYLPVTDLKNPKENNPIVSHLITVYPNPSLGMFYIDTQTYSIINWEVTDVNAKLLKQKMQVFKSGVIDLSDLSKGIYLLKVFTTDGQYYQKLIKN